MSSTFTWPGRRCGLWNASAIVAASVITCGCATIIHGTRQDVGIASTPSGASVAVNNSPVGKTPVVASLRRKDNHIIRIELDGYLPFETTLTRKASGWVWGNLALGGLIGLAVDAISGGLYKLTPEQVTAELAKGTIGESARADDLYFLVALSPDPSWQRIGQLIPEGR